MRYLLHGEVNFSEYNDINIELEQNGAIAMWGKKRLQLNLK